MISLLISVNYQNVSEMILENVENFAFKLAPVFACNPMTLRFVGGQDIYQDGTYWTQESPPWLKIILNIRTPDYSKGFIELERKPRSSMLS